MLFNMVQNDKMRIVGKTYVSADVFHYIGLQRHVQVNSPNNVTQLPSRTLGTSCGEPKNRRNTLTTSSADNASDPQPRRRRRVCWCRWAMGGGRRATGDGVVGAATPPRDGCH